MDIENNTRHSQTRQTNERRRTGWIAYADSFTAKQAVLRVDDGVGEAVMSE